MKHASDTAQVRSANLIIRGTAYYDAEAAFSGHYLKVGAALKLVPEHGNPHDRNALIVRLSSTQHKLGHVSRESAPKYRQLVEQGQIQSTRITGIAREAGPGGGKRLRISFNVLYLETVGRTATRSALTDQICGGLPKSSGVYLLRAPSGRTYYGSSSNLQGRVRRHVDELIAGRHGNSLMQRAWSNGIGWTAFQVCAATPERLAEQEAKAISAAIGRGEALFNLTADGQGGMGINIEPIESIRPRRYGPLRENGERRASPAPWIAPAGLSWTGKSIEQTPKLKNDSPWMARIAWLVSGMSGVIAGILLLTLFTLGVVAFASRHH